MPPKGPRRMERRRQIRLPAAMDAYLEQLAAERGVTVSDLIREAVGRVFIFPQIGNNIPTGGQPDSQSGRER